MGADAMWSGELHSELHSEFYSEALPVEVEEVSWRELESLVPHDSDEAGEVPAAAEPEEEQNTGTAPREWEEKNQRYADLDEQLALVDVNTDAFAVSPGMDKRVTAFRSVVDSYIYKRSQSAVRVQKYSDAGESRRKAYKPTRLDFHADVELVARKALKHSLILWRVFAQEILEEHGERWDSVPMKVVNKIEMTVGSAFLNAGMHPASRYFG